MRLTEVRSIADWFGMAASTTCALHCVVLPVLLISETVLPGTTLSDESFHRAMAWIILPVAVFALGIGCWRHKDSWVLVLGAIGLIGLTLSVAILHDLIGETGERVVTVISAAVLIAAHYRNFRICRACDCEHAASR